MANYSATSPTAPSPTASTASETSTNPNTPRPEHQHQHSMEADQADTNNPRPDQNELSPGDGQAIRSDSSSSDVLGEQLYDIQPTWPRCVDQTKIPALAYWQPTRHVEVFLDIHWAPRGDTGSAFFKLHTHLQLEGALSTRRDGRVTAYVFIHPERIRQLSLNAQPHDPLLGPNTVTLTFALTRPPALVLPKNYNGFGRETQGVMESLRGLAKQLSFTVYAVLPSRTLSVALMQQLCTAVTGQTLSTIATRANLASLYQGHGAQLLEGDGLPEPDSDVNDDTAPLNPPTYEDVGPSPPVVLPSESRCSSFHIFTPLLVCLSLC